MYSANEVSQGNQNTMTNQLITVNAPFYPRISTTGLAIIIWAHLWDVAFGRQPYVVCLITVPSLMDNVCRHWLHRAHVHPVLFQPISTPCGNYRLDIPATLCWLSLAATIDNCHAYLFPSTASCHTCGPQCADHIDW